MDFHISFWSLLPFGVTVFIIGLMITKFTGPYHGDYNFGGVIDGLIWIIGLMFIVILWLGYFLVS